MALLTDDSDIENNWLTTHIGGNGDYYITIISENSKGIKHSHNVRIATSGGNRPTSVLLAIADLHRELENNNLNEYPE